MSSSAEQPVRVLVVDDEQDFAEALVHRLRKRGFAAEAVFGGEAAVAQVVRATYDVVVLDLRMPGLDGLGAWQQLREHDPALQCVVLTGHGSAAAGLKGMELGAADFLQKPTDIDVLATVIQAAAWRGRLGREKR
jgi:DNA-binding response OmpR family regulator